MQLSPMSRYYIRRLIQNRAVALGLVTEPLKETDSQNSAFVDQVVDFSALSSTKVAELDLLVRLHQSFTQLGTGHCSHVLHLESKLFGLLGLVYRSENAHVQPTVLPEILQQVEYHHHHHVKLSQALSYLNQISQVAKKYLGDLITRNYWQSSRPHSSWFVDYEVTSKSEIIYRGGDDYFLTDEQLQQLQAWLKDFINECQRILPRFPHMLAQAKVAPQASGLTREFPTP